MNAFSDRGDFAFGVVNKRYNLIDANKKLLDIIGMHMYQHICSVIFCSDKEKMEYMLENTLYVEKESGIISFQIENEDGIEYKPYMTSVSFDEKEDCWYITVKDIFEMEKMIDIYRNKSKEYLKIIETEENTLFRYYKNTNMFEIFWIAKGIINYRVEEDFDLWQDDMLKNNYINEKHKMNFLKLCEDISNCENHVEAVLETKIISSEKNMDTNIVRGLAMKDVDGYELVVGTWNIYNKFTKSVLKGYTINAYTDSLTGVLNKRAITLYAEEILERYEKGTEERIILGIIDVDCFKDVNDNYGHMFGDEILKEVAEIICQSVEEKGKCGRIGGDEFMIILDRCKEEEEIKNVLSAIRFGINSLYEVKMKQSRLGCSIGTAEFPKNADNYKKLFNLADKALYIAKKKGRNRFVIYDPIKHGCLGEDENRVEIVRNCIKDREMDISNLIKDVFSSNINDIDNFMNYIRVNFEIDRISIFDNEKRDIPLYESKNEQYPTIDIRLFDRLKEDKSKGYFFVDEISYYEYVDNELFETLKKFQTNSSYIFITKRGRIVVFDRCKLKTLWSKQEIRVLTLANNVMSVIYDKF